MNFVNAGGGNYARFLIAADDIQKAISFKVTGGSYNSTLDYFEFDLAENIFVDTVKCPGYNTFALEAGDTKLEVWMWRSDGAGGYSTSTTTAYFTSTVFNTTTTYNTTKTTTTTYNTSRSTATVRSTSTQRTTSTSRSTEETYVTQYSTTTIYNTSRSTFTSGGGGGGCSRGCI